MGLITVKEVKEVKLSDIEYVGKRQREDLGDLDGLAHSIEHHGLIHPITVVETGGEIPYRLVAGQRRLEATISLRQQYAIDRIRAQVVELGDNNQIIELVENLRRKDLNWKEEVKAIAAIHASLGARRTLTGSVIGISDGYLGKYLTVHEYFDEVQEAETFTRAYQYAQGKKERTTEAAIEDELGDIDLQIAGTVSKPPAPDTQDTAWQIQQGDFIEWSKEYSEARFNLIHCDFPYGIDYDQANARAAGLRYEDSEDVYWALIRALNAYPNKFVAKSAHLVFWFSMRHYENTRLALEEGGWTIAPHPLVWVREGGKGMAPDPNREFRRVYETAFIGYKGDRKTVALKNNSVTAPAPSGKGRLHPSEKSLTAMVHIFSALADNTTRMLDPTCGSGSSLRALRVAAPKATALGIELDEEMAEIAKRNVG